MSAETIFALSSGRPPAAIAVIRVSGPNAHAAGAALAGTLPEPRQAAVRDLRDHGRSADEAFAAVDPSSRDLAHIYIAGARALAGRQ